MINALKDMQKDIAYIKLVLVRCANVLDACVDLFNTDSPSYLKEVAIANNMNNASNNIRAVVKIYLEGVHDDE